MKAAAQKMQRVAAAIAMGGFALAAHAFEAPGDEPRPERLRAALVCIAARARGAKPAWFRVYSQGFDSQVAYGLMVGSDSTIRHFTYDSDPSGGRGAGSRFIETPCPAPEVEGESVRCEPR